MHRGCTMRFLSRQECATWLERSGMSMGPDLSPRMSAKAYRGFAVVTPEAVGQLITFLRAVWLNSADGQAALQLLTSWNMFDGTEHIPLMRSLRSAFGATHEIEIQPGAVSEAGELDDALSLFLTSGLFRWDFWLVPRASDGIVVFHSHDGFIEVYVPVNHEGDVEHEFSYWKTEIRALRPRSGSDYY